MVGINTTEVYVLSLMSLGNIHKASSHGAVTGRAKSVYPRKHFASLCHKFQPCVTSDHSLRANDTSVHNHTHGQHEMNPPLQQNALHWLWPHTQCYYDPGQAHALESTSLRGSYQVLHTQERHLELVEGLSTG